MRAACGRPCGQGQRPFLWATFPQFPEALRLIRAWGFTYKSVAFVWLKKNKKADSWFYGLGFWTRANAEICLLATKGHPKRQAADIHQFIISPIEAHSKKPDETRDKIIALMGDLPRCGAVRTADLSRLGCVGQRSRADDPGLWDKLSQTGGDRLMPYVNVPNDLSKIKTKIAFNLTKRQLICFGIGAAIGVPTYLFDPAGHWQHRGAVRYAGDHAPGVPAGDVRKGRSTL